MNTTVKILVFFSVAALLLFGSCKKAEEIKNIPTTAVYADASVLGSYSCSIGHYVVNNIQPRPAPDSTIYNGTVVITYVSPGVILFTENSVTHSNTSYTFDSIGSITLQSFIYGYYPLDYVQFSHNGDTLYCSSGFAPASGGFYGTCYSGIKIH